MTANLAPPARLFVFWSQQRLTDIKKKKKKAMALTEGEKKPYRNRKEGR